MLTKNKSGFTLVELLVVIAIIGILIAMLLPAVQAAREAARRMQCSNQLKQLAVAFHNHASAHGHYPTGGWRWTWIGDPDRGFGKDQPGGWTYTILPYIEQESLHERGAGLSYPTGLSSNSKITELTSLMHVPLVTFHCPSRRAAKLYPPSSDFGTASSSEKKPVNYTRPNPFQVAKSDYAANAGDPAYIDTEPAPTSTNAAAINSFSWPSDDHMTGVVFQRSTITPAEITDGTSCTYAVGEKFMSPDNYNDPEATGFVDTGDNESIYLGYNRDYSRSTNWIPMQDTYGVLMPFAFGSPHPSGCNMAFCDGSVRTISYEIDEDTHRFLGCRADGIALDSEDY